MNSASTSISSIERFKAIVALLRPCQWVKNLFVFLPIFFDRHLFQADFLWPTLAIFFAFSFVASAVYCFNDIHDVEFDKLHPVKKNRPIATGLIKPSEAYCLCALSAGMGGHISKPVSSH